MSSGATAGIIITLGVMFIIGGTTAVIVWSWHRLQQHRADAVAMASYRKLAEEAVANQAELRDEMRKLAEHVSAVEQLMRDVG
jgi:predicted negative regulator of RcsB-dependent stress response